MTNSKQPEVVTALPGDVFINHNVATEARQKASAKVSRANVVNLRDDPEAKAAFLSTFSAGEEKRIMRKVNKVFFLLTGIMYLIKQVKSMSHHIPVQILTSLQVDQNNATNVRVLQAGKPSNIMKELKMSSNEYNWVGSIYGVISGRFWST
tara:strand:- start:1907 stop:2359 length:453 start_codon:yes stop_codon:yes gene_type:complete